MISKHLTALSMILACSASVASVACGGSDDKPAASANDVTTTTSTTDGSVDGDAAGHDPGGDPGPG